MPKTTALRRQRPRDSLLESARRDKRRIQNGRNERGSGAGSQYDFGTMNQPGPSGWLSPLHQDQLALQLFQTDWQAKKIVGIPVDDMLRDGWNIEGPAPEQVKALERAQDMMGALTAFRQAHRLERLLGGAIIVLGVADGKPAREPLDYATLQQGSLKFMNVVPRNRVHNVDYDQDPLSPHYGRPERYWVNSECVHRSRLIVFRGDPLLDIPDSSIALTGRDRNDGFGHSVLLSIYDDLVRATGTRQSAMQLVQRAGSFLAVVEEELTDDNGENVEQLQRIVNSLNNYRGAVLTGITGGGASNPITSITPNFGSVPELVTTMLQVLSAASDIPATRFLGQAPGGLNATGESDLESYYGRLESAQRQMLRPKLFQFLQVLIPSVLGAGAYDAGAVEVTFEPLWSMSAKEEADANKVEAETLIALVESSLLEPVEARREMVARGMLETDLNPEELPEPIEEEPPAPPLAQSIAALGG